MIDVPTEVDSETIDAPQEEDFLVELDFRTTEGLGEVDSLLVETISIEDKT